MAKIDAAIAIVSVGVISTCAVSLAVLATAPKTSFPLSPSYGYGSAAQYGYGYGYGYGNGYGYGYGYNAGYGYGYNPAPVTTGTTSTPTSTASKLPRGTTPPIIVRPGYPKSPDTNPKQ
jgi:hypothetical protein